MPDENGTVTIRPETPSADDALFGDAADTADDTDAAVVEEQGSSEETEQDVQGAADDGDKPEAEEPADAEAQTDASEELKVVVSIKGGRAVIGVQQPSSDPHIETFEDHDLHGLAQEIPAVTERARARWEEAPKHPAYERPAPPPKRRNNRRQQGVARGATDETQEADTQQQTLRLF